MCGLNGKIKTINLAKLSAYFALSFSSVLLIIFSIFPPNKRGRAKTLPLILIYYNTTTTAEIA